jgi:hypothetical protein
LVEARHCGGSQDVAGTIPDVVIEIFIVLILPAHCGPRVDPASNRNEYREYLLAIKAAGA